MPAEGRENPLLKKGNSDAFFREKYLTKNRYAPKPLRARRSTAPFPVRIQSFNEGIKLGNAAVLLGGSFLRRRFRLILIDPNCKDKQLSGAS